MTTPAIYVGPAATAVTNNTVLPAGAIGITNEGGIKVGPGFWNDLPYLATRHDTDSLDASVAATQAMAQTAIALLAGTEPPTSVSFPPVLITQPLSQQVTAPASATFSVNAVGGNLNFVWSRNGVPIPGATSKSYTTGPTTTDDNFAVFFCAVFNTAGGVVSSHAQLFVAAAGSAPPPPPPAPAPQTVTANLLSLTTPDNPTYRIGDRAVATLAPGITGDFGYTRERFPISGAIGSGQTATYIRTDKAAGAITNVAATLTATLAASFDLAAALSFYGSSNVGEIVTARLGYGCSGDLEIRRADGTPVAVGGSATRITYTVKAGDAPLTAVASKVTASDADKLLNVIAKNLVFTAGRVSAYDPAAVVSLYGTGSVGSTVTAAFGAQCKGDLQVLRANGTVAASGAGVASLDYVVQAGDAPLTATGANLVYTVPIPFTAGSGMPVGPFLSIEARMLGQAVAVGDTFIARLAAGVMARIDFLSDGALFPFASTGIANSRSCIADTVDVGHQISVVISDLQFTTAGIYGAPAALDTMTPPFLYGVRVTNENRGEIELSYMALNDLDPTHVPAPGDYAITARDGSPSGKTVTVVAIDNASREHKFARLRVSPVFAPNEHLSLSYTGTQLRHPGGQPAPTFSNLLIFTTIPDTAPLLWPDNSYDIARATEAGKWFFQRAEDNSQRGMLIPQTYFAYSGQQDVTVQMEVLDDWGTDAGLTRSIGLANRPQIIAYEQFQVRRNGNTFQYREVADFGVGGQNAPVGAPFTFTQPGPLCLARLRRSIDDQLVRFETSEDGGVTWTLRTLGSTKTTAGLAATAFCSSTTIPVTGVAATGLTH